MSYQIGSTPKLATITDSHILSIALAQAAHNKAPAAIVDKKSCYVYANQPFYKINNFNKKLHVEGRRYHEMPAAWAEYSDSYEQQDRMTIQHKKATLVLNTHEIGTEKKITSYLGVTRPIFNVTGDIIGIQCEALLVNSTLLKRFFITERPALLHLTPPLEVFTKRELEVIFFTLQGLSAKEIANRMNLSYRTIENKLQIMYRKIDVTNLLQLREYGRAWGFQNYIPPRLVQAGVTFL